MGPAHDLSVRCSITTQRVIALGLAMEAMSHMSIDPPSKPIPETYSKKRRKGLTDKSNLRHKYHK